MATTSKIRIYELAKELGKDNKEMQRIVRGLGFEIKNQMSTLTTDEAERVRRHLRGDAPPVDKVNKSSRRRATVLRRRATTPRPAEREREAREAEVEVEPEPEERPRPRIISRPGPVVRSPESGAVLRRPSPSSQVEAPPRSDGVPVRSTPMVRHAETPSSSVTSAASIPEAQLPLSDPQAQQAQRRRPAVGERIELPANTRKLPGGLAERLEKRKVEEATRPPVKPRVEDARPARPAAPPEPRPQQQPQAKAAEASEPEPAGEEDQASGRRVVRNDAGVIVGVAKQRSEPRITGFIQLNQPRPRQQVIITDAGDEPRGGRASQRKKREERIQQQGRRRPMRTGRGRPTGAERPRVLTLAMSDAKKRIRVDEAIQISDLAHQMGKKAGAVMRVLWGMGLRGLTINHAIDLETAELVATEFGYTVENVSFQENEIVDMDRGEGEPRAPVVTMMGHVDHGKTSLLDKIRSATVAEGESGGITQHIGAYRVSTAKGDVVFLDTPGHEAFSAMRSRGAQVTDVVVLVVAADDGVMPTTVEAIKHANEADTPILVAINKIDKPEANPGRVKQMLMEHQLVGEEFGGETIICEVSAKTGKGIDKMLEMLALQTELLDLRASPAGRASGVVLEARVDKGRGPIATVLIEEGTLKTGDIVVANEFSGKVRGMISDRGKSMKKAGPAMPVEVLGIDGVPSAGDRIDVVESEKAAKQLVTHRREQRRRKESVATGPSIKDLIQRKKTPTLKIVLRADVDGSAEALKQALLDLSTEKVKVDVIFSGVGAITQNDVKTASAADAVIIGFNTKPVGKTAQAAEADQVSIQTFNVIYDALDATKALMLGMLDPEYREREQGEAEVRALFPIPRLGVVAGCRVVKGIVTRSSNVRVIRNGEMIHRGTIGSLRVFKDDVKEVREGHECGIVIHDFPEVEPGDIIQTFELETIQPTL